MDGTTYLLYARCVDGVTVGHDRNGGPRCLVLPVKSLEDVPENLRDTPEKVQKIKEIFFLE